MAIRPHRPGEEGRPNTAEERLKYKQELEDAQANPELWANDPVLKEQRAKITALIEKGAYDAAERAANDALVSSRAGREGKLEDRATADRARLETETETEIETEMETEMETETDEEDNSGGLVGKVKRALK